ncbi:uncharacterized protein LOC117317745 [Pecten maximus]|uniref:uncharacterized protein LOC117317745 n=1 Tax=Pecten maximus TaxID=6579 RepID=UPI0014583563|nr:uncharacterized protein LOC117317745 [Pecten maximus]
MQLGSLAILGFVLLINVGHGSAQASVCNSYNAIQRLYCLGMRAPTPDERERLFSGGYFTREGLQVFLNVWCSSLLQYGPCISSNTQQCSNQEELHQLHLENGGLCTANGEVDPQVQPFLQTFVQTALTGDCARFWRTVFNPCYPRGYSEIPDRPDSSMNISLGIEWWTRRRTNTVRCIMEKDTPPSPDSCEGTTEVDAKIFAVLDNLWSEPYGVGAHVDISEFIDQI